MPRLRISSGGTGGLGKYTEAKIWVEKLALWCKKLIFTNGPDKV